MGRTVTTTVVFTDLVGSTALLARVGEDRAEVLRREHFSVLRAAIGRHRGQEVKNLGDGLMVVFDSVVDAIACAIAMQQTLAVRNRRDPTGENLEIRVGIGSGECDTDDGDYFGAPVVEAARLCDRAGGGEILIGALVRLVAGGRGGYDLLPVGELALKGLPEPVEAFSVGWEPPVADAIPLPGRLAPGAAAFRFVGRREELETIAVAVKAADAGERQVLLISGEPGIGKSALAREVARERHEAGEVVLHGRCDEELSVPYQPVAEALTHYVDHAAPDLLSQHVEVYGGDLLPLVPALARRVASVPPSRGTDPDSERYLCFAAANGMLEAASVDNVVTLVLDDLHWADKPTLLLLRHLLSSPQLSRLLIIATYRDSDVAPGHPLADLLVWLQREPSVRRIALRGLDDRHIGEMIAESDGDADAALEFARMLRRETDGNPFFTIELLQHLVDVGSLGRDVDTGQWIAPAELAPHSLPPSVRSVIGQRVERLGSDARRLLSIGAVIGPEFDTSTVAVVADVDEDTLLGFLERATTAGLVNEISGRVERFGFAHALIQHTLYDDLSATRRARLHHRVGEALEVQTGWVAVASAAELARHFVAATQPTDVIRAVLYCRQAGDDALAALAPEEARRWYTQALELLPFEDEHEPLRCDLLIGLGTAQRQGGDPAHRETLLEAAGIARSRGDADRLVAAVLANTRGLASAVGLVDNERIATIEAALAALDGRGERETTDRSRLLALLAAELSWSATDLERRRRLAQEAVDIAQRIDDPATLVRVLSFAFHACYVAETLSERNEWSKQALTASARTGDPLLRSTALILRLLACIDAGDYGPIPDYLAEQDAIHDRLGEPELRYEAAIIHAAYLLACDDIEGATVASQTILEAGAAASLAAEATAVWGSVLLASQWRRGDLEDLLPLIEQAINDLPDLAAVKPPLACIDTQVRRQANARAALDAELATGFRDIPDDRIRLGALCAWSFVAAETAHADAARVLSELIAPFHDQAVAPFQPPADGSVAHYLGRLALVAGDLDRARGYLDEADRMYARIGSAYWSAANDLAIAELLIRRGDDPDGARARLDSATATAESRGYNGLARKAVLLRSR